MNERSPNPSEPERPSDATLQRVWLDNVRANQIGGETDGISPEVAADMGFAPPEKNKIDANANDLRPSDESSEEPTALFGRNEAEIDAAQDRHPTTYGRSSSNSKKRRIFSGPVRGDSELDTNKPVYFEEFTMTPEEQAEQDEINKRGAQQAREAMRSARSEQQRSLGVEWFRARRNRNLTSDQENTDPS